MRLGLNGPNRFALALIQGKFLLQDLRWNQGTRGSDPPVFEPEQRFLERHEDTVIAHYFDGSANCGRQTFVKSGRYFLVSTKSVWQAQWGVGDKDKRARVNRVSRDMRPVALLRFNRFSTGDRQRAANSDRANRTNGSDVAETASPSASSHSFSLKPPLPSPALPHLKTTWTFHS